jgi:hypothetical protein
MKTIPLEGTFSSVSFYEDDTIARVRELIAIERGSHPDRLFLQVLVTLPEGYYASPKEWTGLFFRLSRDGRTVTDDVLRMYTTSIRPDLAGVPVRSYTQEQWEQDDSLKPLRNGGPEWQILGARIQTILPLPPRDLALPTKLIPLLASQSLYETMHPYPVSAIRVTELPADASDAVQRNYFPLLRPDTPSTLDATKGSILKAQDDLGKLLALSDVKAHQEESIVKAKWYIPLNATTIAAPRVQFEQMFYGLTLSPTTPYVGYFTSATDSLRSKFYVEDPKLKKPVLDTTLLRGWLDMTRPQRRRPTLLLYKGSSRFVFTRIAITATDITIDVRKAKGSSKELEDLQAEAKTWLMSLDAVVPFLDARDLDVGRWELSEMSLLASYATEETEFDMRRFGCLQTIFGVQDGTFRLLRAEHASESVTPQILQAYQILNQEGAAQTPETLAEEMDLSLEEATALLNEMTSLSEDINLERSLRSYPTMKFTGKDVLIRFATDPERALKYADILRTVLTTPDSKASSELKLVCPSRGESVAPLMSVPQEGEAPAEEEVDDELLALLGVTEEAAPEPAAPEPVKKSRKLKVADELTTTQNYFNARLNKFNADLFDSSYSKTCEKSQQVVVLTPGDKARIGPDYNYEGAPETEQLEIPGGTAICPPYWCMRDEIPLRADQLVPGDDGVLTCPMCGGKVRPNDKVGTKEYSVIQRASKGRPTPYPGFIKQKEGVPCCYLKPSGKAVTRNLRADETYVLNEDATEIPAFRVARLPASLAERLGVKTMYDTSISKGRLEFGAQDVFRIGLGRPRDTLPTFLRMLKTEIPTPADARDIVKRCSFYSTWRSTTPIEDIDRAYREKTLDTLYEVEYISYILDFAVILVNTETMQVLCGFRTDLIRGNNKTIVLLDKDLLGLMMRRRTQEKGYITEYEVQIDDPRSQLNRMSSVLLASLKSACTTGFPTLEDAQMALDEVKLATYVGITDPNGRLQAILVPGKLILPIAPTTETIPGAPTPKSYADVTDEDLPPYDSQVAYLKAFKRQDLFGFARDHRDVHGQIVEVETTAGFRVPVRPKPSAGRATEVTQTIRMRGEESLVMGTSDPEPKALKDKIDYESELYEFLLFSLATDIQSDGHGKALKAEYDLLRTAVQTKDAAKLKKALAAWYKAEAYEEKTKTPYQFLSKVRTPCGQLTSEDTCKQSSLCGWRKGDCKVQVRTSQVDKDKLMARLQTTLLTNDKQRALVLDARLSPFFSTVLYLEMPHEWITTSF